MSNDIKQESFEQVLDRFRNRSNASKELKEKKEQDPNMGVEKTSEELKYTLKYLLERNGGNPTFVRPTWWKEGWFCVHGICTTGQKEAFGYTDRGVGIGYQADQAVWMTIKMEEV